MLSILHDTTAAALQDLLKMTKATILPFTERPSSMSNLEARTNTEKSGINATDLFSFFTADIIKQEVLFTR